MTVINDEKTDFGVCHRLNWSVFRQVFTSFCCSHQHTGCLREANWVNLLSQKASRKCFHPVDGRVSLQMCISCESFPTNWTAKWSLPRVDSQVPIQILLPCESHSTNWTTKRFLSCVASHVGHHISFPLKIFLTDWAAETFPFYVKPHVRP